MIYKAIQKLRFLSSVTLLYAVTLFLLWQSIVSVVAPSSNKVQAQKIPIANIKPKPKPEGIKMQSGQPIKIIIPELRISKEILPGIYDVPSNSWIVSDIGVHFASLSNPPNDYIGNTLIYGHNNKFTFGPLQYLEAGNIAEVYTENNLKFTYIYKQVVDFDPNDTSIFDYKGKPKLSLQTCTGWLNQIRSLHQFDFVKAEKVNNVIN